MKVLVTGGSGFIGSHVVDKLLVGGHEPRVFDLRPSPHHDSDEVETVDRRPARRRGRLDRTRCDGCDAVIHLAAARRRGRSSPSSPSESERVNARGTLTVLEAARTSGVERVIYGSTIWVYSESATERQRRSTRTLCSACPKHLYTASKLAGEMYCTSYAELYERRAARSSASASPTGRARARRR